MEGCWLTLGLCQIRVRKRRAANKKRDSRPIQLPLSGEKRTQWNLPSVMNSNWNFKFNCWGIHRAISGRSTYIMTRLVWTDCKTQLNRLKMSSYVRWIWGLSATKSKLNWSVFLAIGPVCIWGSVFNGPSWAQLPSRAWNFGGVPFSVAVRWLSGPIRMNFNWPNFRDERKAGQPRSSPRTGRNNTST